MRSPRISFDKMYALPSARKIRVEAFPTGQIENNQFNVNSMQWGQFMTHDMSLQEEPDTEFECCTEDQKYEKSTSRFCFPIKVPANDPTMGRTGIRCMNFTRSLTDKDIGCSQPNAPAEQLNVVTSWMDLSHVYGLNKEMSDELRTFKNGQLATEVRNGIIFPPHETNFKDNCPCNRAGENHCYKTGDSRANQSPQLTILQILFLREHNRIASELSKINPQWNDEKLFQEARRILIAVFQHISFYEWSPIFLGLNNLIKNKIIYKQPGYINDYNKRLNPHVTNEHAHGANRFFHTHIVGQLKLLNANRQTDSVSSISKWFNRPHVLENTSSAMQQLTIGMVTQNLEASDNVFVKEVTEEMFACEKEFGIDLRATDIQRDRDHAMSYYNDYRKYCNFKVARCFDDYKDLIPADKVEILKKLYKDYRDVDLSVGGTLETLAPGAEIGPTFQCIINEQFLRTRQADRFWYEHSTAGFTLAQLKEIKKSTVSKLFCDSGDGITSMQPNGFAVIKPKRNELRPCNQIPAVNLTMWKA
ncbi:peroxidase-like isoform X2 [Arctopsyche grandis]